MTTATAEPQTLQEAFTQAKASLSAENEPAPAEASTETATATQPDETQTESPAAEPVTSEISDLISDEEYSTLKATHANDPDAIAKELKAAFTKKTQSLAEQRKGIEKIARYKDFIEALEADPQTALSTVAEQLGFSIAPKTVEAKAAEAAVTKATEMAAGVVDQVKAALGPDFDFLAEPLARALDSVIKTAVGEVVEPLKSSQQALLSKAAKEQEAAILASFTEKHPDWKTHEAQMNALIAKYQPGKDADPLDYLEGIYQLATKDIAVGEAVKKAIEKMSKTAQADEGKSRTVADTQVADVPPDPSKMSDGEYLQWSFAQAKKAQGR